MNIEYRSFWDDKLMNVKIFDKKTTLISDMFEHIDCFYPEFGDTEDDRLFDNEIISESLIRSMCVYDSEKTTKDELEINDFKEIATGHFDTYSGSATEPVEIKDIINCFQLNDEIIISCVFTYETIDENISDDTFGYIAIPIDFYILSTLNNIKYPFTKTCGCGRFYPTVNNIHDYMYWQDGIKEGKEKLIGFEL